MKYVLYFNEINKEKFHLAGGKGINLGELFNNNFVVPDGFCITTEAYDLLMENKTLKNLIENLNTLDYNDRELISGAAEKIREIITGTEVSEAVKITVYGAWNNLGANYSYAIRSSATAEDLKGISFAGQQDTYLNVKGYENIIKAVQNCWASLFTERAIIYRNKNGFDNSKVKLAVIVQKMIGSEYSGIMFTADPISGNRKIVNIDAGYGLGEALVSGLVTPDFYQIYNSEIINKKIARKEKGVFPDNEGGVIEVEIVEEYMEKQVLSDEQIVKLAKTGVRIQETFGSPQDIEWGFYQGKFHILQSRPITSLFPIPKTYDNQEHLFFSFGHIQMMTDAMKPLALSIFETTRIFDKFGATDSTSLQYEAGGRIYIDLSHLLSVPKIRENISGIMKYADEHGACIIKEIIDRGDTFAADEEFTKKAEKFFAPILFKIGLNLHVWNVNRLKIRGEKFFKNESLKWERDINSYKGTEKIKRIRWYVSGMLNFLFSKAMEYPGSALVSLSKIKEMCKEYFTEEETAELLAQLNMSLDNNVTSNMMMEIYDMADMARGSKELDSFMKNTTNETFWEDLENLKTHLEFTLEMKKFISKYGMRCSGEIDITRKRWKEAPVEILPLIMNHIKTSEMNEHREKFKKGQQLAKKAEEKIISGIKEKAGSSKARKVSKYIKIYRNMMGFRESPKYFLVKFLDLARSSVLDEAEVLKEAGIIDNKEDIFYFSLDEIISILDGLYNRNIDEVLEERKTDFDIYKKMSPPRMMTSDGEVLNGELENSSAPEGALLGTAASAGIKEGTANVILKLSEADLKEGEILVTMFTDPAWTPLFNAADALVTEVGGMMTHGSVVAREYGIPAVVGIDGATEKIKTGDRIRVNGTGGYVEILTSSGASRESK
jgi:phosphoenolpyruvate synthase/pyruvate phosphate dikinase